MAISVIHLLYMTNNIFRKFRCDEYLMYVNILSSLMSYTLSAPVVFSFLPYLQNVFKVILSPWNAFVKKCVKIF